ncbi:hypothetical protein E4U54_004064, partial [Claviceps lovelessii]
PSHPVFPGKRPRKRPKSINVTTSMSMLLMVMAQSDVIAGMDDPRPRQHPTSDKSQSTTTATTTATTNCGPHSARRLQLASLIPSWPGWRAPQKWPAPTTPNWTVLLFPRES